MSIEEYSPSGIIVSVVTRVSLISPLLLLLTQSTGGLLLLFTDRLNVLLMVFFETVVITVYSVWFPKRCHLMDGKGTPWLTHTQVRTFEPSLHPDDFKILGKTGRIWKNVHRAKLCRKYVLIEDILHKTHWSPICQCKWKHWSQEKLLHRCIFQSLL